ncbi:von Willebrand factor type A domain protein [Novipirellula artificiosorum]|uniref:von Willebrand factor type A domain protein n=2 Tax=Novipirellula artificiosorum TaxID=2528016 RepID=A0A5C6E0M8_9BACT|nr:von Willebrand factor type A domain protein [Novipirellula artificiosorum]
MRRRGAMLVLIVFMLIGFMMAVTFSVDIAQMHLSRTELRSATDAASKAAALELSMTLDRDLAVQRGQQIAALNTVNNQPLIIDAGEFEFGHSEESLSGKFDFVSNQTPLNSVKVNGKRTVDSPSGAVPLFFGNMVGFSFFEPQSHATATYIERDVVLVVDRSGSMAGQKISDLRAAIDIFVATLNDTSVDEQVGLASYNDQSTQDVQLTPNLSQISSAMGSMPVGGWTSISRGMDAGEAIMNNSRDSNFVERTMIVMTDGQHNRGAEPRTSATRIAADGVTIHTITFGAGADIVRMREVATIGGGKHYHAASGAELREIYREIALTLSTMMTE